MDSMLLLLDVNTLIELNTALGYFFFAFTGSYIQEILAVYRGTQKRTKIYKIIIGTIIGALIYFIIKEKWFSDLGIISSMVINVFSGSVAYEVYSKCSSIESLKKFAIDIHDILSNILGIDSLLQGKKDNKSKKEDDGE